MLTSENATKMDFNDTKIRFHFCNMLVFDTSQLFTD